jgi:hypothetical protein
VSTGGEAAESRGVDFVRFRVAMPMVVAAAAVAAVAVTLAVPSTRAGVIAALHLRAVPAGAEPILPDGRVVGHGNLRIAAQPPVPKPALTARNVQVNGAGFLSWALVDRQSGKVAGSPNYISGTSTTESMIKAWLAADYLRLLGNKQPTAQRLTELSRMIRSSDDDAAEDIYQVSGPNSVIRRMISICGLTETVAVPGWWSRTEVSARDAARLGLCIGDGRAAGPRWTGWLLSEMRQVRGDVSEQPGGGRWGIIDALPPDVADDVAIKNGWTLLYDEGEWRINCLAVHADWVLAVLTSYPAKLGKRYGADLCKQVTQQLLAA